MFAVYQRDKGYVTEVNFEDIITTLNFNKIIYFEGKIDADNFAKFLNEYDEMENYEVREIIIK